MPISRREDGGSVLKPENQGQLRPFEVDKLCREACSLLLRGLLYYEAEQRS